ncbi:hypothetical protein QFC21_000845 [Naganishia friedmannii]|uniref:Uncharacterized protein n=1 Tax=Naganishia friedmannii TaxID=89922 RepID=A0ACC2W6M3_9TREE|nr:hypothetical protein QFC21_000845 [Naganishia friedmannii]
MAQLSTSKLTCPSIADPRARALTRKGIRQIVPPADHRRELSLPPIPTPTTRTDTRTRVPLQIFYATFHPKQGPIVPYKVPESLISHNELGVGVETSQGAPNSRRGSLDPQASITLATQQTRKRSADGGDGHGSALPDREDGEEDEVLAFHRRASAAARTRSGRSQERLMFDVVDGTPVSPRTTATPPTTTAHDAQPAALPTVPEPPLSSQSSLLHTCSAPGSTVVSRDVSPSVPVPFPLQMDPVDDARARRLGTFTSNNNKPRRGRQERLVSHGTMTTAAHDESCSSSSSVSASETSDREQVSQQHAHPRVRGRQPAAAAATTPPPHNVIRCASESPSRGLERLATPQRHNYHQSHIHAVNIGSTSSAAHPIDPTGASGVGVGIGNSSTGTSIGIGEESHRRGSFGQLVSASLDSQQQRMRQARLASRSRTRAPVAVASASAAAGRTSSVSPSRGGSGGGGGGRFRGMRSSSPAGNYRVPSVAASTCNGSGRDRDTSLLPAPTTQPPPPHQQPLLDFSQISEYIIGKSALKHRLVTCTLGNYRILSFPCVIEDERYPRNQFIWNLAFVFDQRSDLSGFEPVLDSQYLTHRSTRANIQNVIDQMFEDLNSYSETSITIDGINYLELKLFPFYPNPAVVEDWHVPVPLIDFSKVRDDNWDITAQRVSEHINGVNHVSRIAELADADIDCYSNMYTVKPSIQKMSRDPSVSVECGIYTTRPDYQQPSWPVLLELYSALRPGVTVHQWAIDNAQAVRGIDIRRFITFGIIKGFVRRVHRWPIMEEWVVTAPPSVSVGGAGQESGMDSMISRISSDQAPQGRGQMLERMRQGQRKSSTSQTQWTSFSDRHSQQNNQKEDGNSQHKTSGMTIRSNKSTDSLLMATSPREAGLAQKMRSAVNNPHIRRESHTSGLTSGFMRIPGTGAGGASRGVSMMGGATEIRPNQSSHAYIQPSSMAVAPSTSLPSNSNLSSHQSSFAGQGLSTSHATNNSSGLRPPSLGSAHVATGSGNRRSTGAGTASVYGNNGNANAYQSGGSGQGYNSRRTAGPNNRHSSRLLSSQRQSHLSFKSYQNQSIEEQEAQIKEELKPYLDGTHHTDEIQVRFKMPWKRLDSFLRRIALEAEDAWDFEGRGWASGGSTNGGAEWSETKRKERAEAAERGDYGKVVIVLR